jgi:hypothetical protein
METKVCCTLSMSCGVFFVTIYRSLGGGKGSTRVAKEKKPKKGGQGSGGFGGFGGGGFGGGGGFRR